MFLSSHWKTACNTRTKIETKLYNVKQARREKNGEISFSAPRNAGIFCLNVFWGCLCEFLVQMPFLPLSFYLQYLICVFDSNFEMLYLAELWGFASQGLLAPGFLRFHCSKSAIGWIFCASFNPSHDLTVGAFCSDTSSRCSGGRRRCSSNRRTTAGHHGGLAFAPFIPVSNPTFKCRNSQGDVKCYIYGWILSKEQSFGGNILKMRLLPCWRDLEKKGY